MIIMKGCSDDGDLTARTALWAGHALGNYSTFGGFMKLCRAALVVATGALAPALLLSTPVLAATGSSSSSGVAAVVATDTGSPYDTMSEDDLRIAVLRILADPATGRGVDREARKALDGTVEDLRNFLKTGRAIAQDEDNRVAIFTILGQSTSGKAVKREASKALEGTAADRAYFLQTGLRLAQAEDDRVAIFRILADPSSSQALRVAAQKALEGTAEEMRYFLEIGRYHV
ncbi:MULTISPECIES: ALF repeat-containing protein [unclassified Streptomyces]|uniref:ALF repeat-containing protein n=1 Tax=unclassified Streptomyces TaxID=2593676 RepID=UPI0033E50865